MTTTTEPRARVDLLEHGIRAAGDVYRNPTTSQLYEHALARGEARLAAGGPMVVDTGKHTGRSPKDKFVVREPGSDDRIWFGDVNAGVAEENFDGLRDKVTAYLGGATTSTSSTHSRARTRRTASTCASSPTARTTRSSRRRCSSSPTEEELADFEPQALVLHAPALEADPAKDGTRTGTFVVLHPTRAEVLIGGTFYAGEIKKSIFTVMNDRLPLEGVLPMHCSANVGDDGRVAIFFGLSGTGKTTLSADPERRLIGDDEHGWGDSGVFNFEGGCYAKVIRLSAEAEPEIYRRPTPSGRSSRTSSSTSAGGRPRRRLEDREHARGLQARADRQRAAGKRPAIRRRSSSSPRTHSGSCRRSRGSRATRRSTTSSRASRRSWPGPRSA